MAAVLPPIDPGEAQGMPTGPHDPDRPLYLRIGAWNPKREYSRNYATGKQEPGISAYSLDDKGQPIVPDEGEWAEDDLRDRLRGNDPKFLVHGEHVGYGGDGEPLLQKLFAVHHWQPNLRDFMRQRNAAAKSRIHR